jgi:hypothetical protein
MVVLQRVNPVAIHRRLTCVKPATVYHLPRGYHLLLTQWITVKSWARALSVTMAELREANPQVTPIQQMSAKPATARHRVHGPISVFRTRMLLLRPAQLAITV